MAAEMGHTWPRPLTLNLPPLITWCHAHHYMQPPANIREVGVMYLTAQYFHTTNTTYVPLALLTWCQDKDRQQPQQWITTNMKIITLNDKVQLVMMKKVPMTSVPYFYVRWNLRIFLLLQNQRMPELFLRNSESLRYKAKIIPSFRPRQWWPPRPPTTHQVRKVSRRKKGCRINGLQIRWKNGQKNR